MMSKINKKILLLFFLAFLIRLIALNQSLWLDEGTTAKAVMNYNYWDIITKFSPHDFHPPLYYLFIKLWTSIFGVSEISLRIPSILFSLLAGYFIYLIGKRLFWDGVGLWAAVFFLFNPLVIYYSQEARMYMMATFFLTIGLYFLIKIQNSESRIQNYNLKFKIVHFLLAVFLSLALATFYGSIFFIAAILIYLLYKKQYKTLLVIGGWLLGVGLILSPLLYQQLVNAKQSLQFVTNWSLVLGKANLKNLLLIPIKFTSGRISWEPKWAYYFIAGLWLLVTGYWIIKAGLKNRLLLFLLLCPLIFGFLISFNTPLLQYFRFIYLIVPMSLLLGLGANKNWQRYFLLTGFLIFSLVYLLNSNFYREDWKSLAKQIPSNTVIYAIPSSMDALYYYRKDLRFTIYDLRQLNQLVNNLIVIPYTSEIYGLDYRESLKKKKYSLTEAKSLRGLTVEHWRRTK